MVCLRAGRWQHTSTRDNQLVYSTDDLLNRRKNGYVFSFDYVIKEMVNVAALQPSRVMDPPGRFAKHSGS